MGVSGLYFPVEVSAAFEFPSVPWMTGRAYDLLKSAPIISSGRTSRSQLVMICTCCADAALYASVDCCHTYDDNCHCQLENRQQEELAELQQRLEKEMQTLHASLARELDSDAQHQAKERERSQKSAVAAEAKRRKHIQQLHEMELKQLHQQQKREYQKNKEEVRKVTYQIADVCYDYVMLCYLHSH